MLLLRPVAFQGLADKKIPDAPWKDILTGPDLGPAVFTNPTAKARAHKEAVSVFWVLGHCAAAGGGLSGLVPRKKKKKRLAHCPGALGRL